MAITQTISGEGWTVSIDMIPSGTRGVFGIVTSLSVDNQSDHYTINLWLDYRGQHFTAQAPPGTSGTIDLTPFPQNQGDVTGFGAF